MNSYKYNPDEMINTYTNIANKSKSSLDSQFKDYQAYLEPQKNDIAQMYSQAKTGAYTGARVSALGNNERLANQGLAGNAYEAPKSGYSETMRIYQDVNLQNNLRGINQQEINAMRALEDVITNAYQETANKKADIDTTLMGNIASEEQKTQDVNYTREQTILGNVNSATNQGLIVDPQTQAYYEQITGTKYMDYFRQANPEAASMYDYRNTVQENATNENLSANAKAILGQYSGENPYLYENGNEATTNILQNYAEGKITPDDFKVLVDTFGKAEFANSLENINEYLAGKENSDYLLSLLYGTDDIEKVLDDVGIEIEWKDIEEAGTPQQVEHKASNKLYPKWKEKTAEGDSGTEYEIDGKKYNVNWMKNKEDKENFNSANLDKVESPEKNKVYKGADERYYLYNGKKWLQLEEI